MAVPKGRKISMMVNSRCSKRKEKISIWFVSARLWFGEM